MARWSVIGNKGVANVQGVLYLQAAAANMRRAKLYDWIFGCSQSPADNTFLHICQRTTTLPTGAARTPNSLDPADTLASTIVTTDTITADGALTANAFEHNVPLNQRATFRWVAAPYGELIIPATASNGFALGLSVATTTTFGCTAHYEEY